MQTILIEVLKFLGTSAASGLTWDVIKAAGGGILSGFKKCFSSHAYFEDETQAEKFMEDITCKESLNRRHPLEDVWLVYDNCTGREATDSFKKEFVDWLENHKEELKRLEETASSTNGIFIRKQVNKDNAHVVNIGNQYIGGNVNVDEKSEKYR